VEFATANLLGAKLEHDVAARLHPFLNPILGQREAVWNVPRRQRDLHEVVLGDPDFLRISTGHSESKLTGRDLEVAFGLSHHTHGARDAHGQRGAKHDVHRRQSATRGSMVARHGCLSFRRVRRLRKTIGRFVRRHYRSIAQRHFDAVNGARDAHQCQRLRRNRTYGVLSNERVEITYFRSQISPFPRSDRREL